MKQLAQKLVFGIVSLFAVSALTVAPAVAQRGADDGQIPDDSTTSSEQSGADDTEEVKSRFKSFSETGKKEVEALKTKSQDAKKKTDAERQKSCETRAAELTKKLNKKVADAQKHKDVFDKIYTRVKSFHDTKQLNTPDYDALVAKVDSAQAAAQTSIETLKAFDTSVDCTQVDAVAAKVAGFRDALKSTRDSLKAYRTAIKDLIVAVKGSIPEDTTTTTGGAN